MATLTLQRSVGFDVGECDESSDDGWMEAIEEVESVLEFCCEEGEEEEVVW
jgi:hypothetical protein